MTAARSRPGAGEPARPAAEPVTIPTTTTSHLSVTTTTTTAVTVPPGLPPEKCPEPKTCRHYAFTTGSPPRYPAGADGRVTLEYWLNPTGLDTTTMTVEEAEGALAAAFDTWQRAAPTLRFVYRGRTDKLAASGDGVNVVSFQGRAETHPRGDEFDMTYSPRNWMWAPCEQRDGACTRVERRNLAGNNYLDEFQDVATHEAGHALGLAHVNDPELDRWMTMYGAAPGGSNRHRSTLALGDVLGIRALYPCSCPLPPIYDP